MYVAAFLDRSVNCRIHFSTHSEAYILGVNLSTTYEGLMTLPEALRVLTRSQVKIALRKSGIWADSPRS